ncbi:BTB/POZ domain protein [Rhizoctonia solani AG-3 Rhs1AP]|uniref:BTB/POZ domain protein n=2 Tax=Rhizoctonia solani AG-3 TaxID=1086053 RepID=A0A074RUZ7_9AGAM|nr:BTB/POZ domain protein [Rhizoctonia solani AG-3 Rhs1AP]KEP48473.1 BTB/POZ domain protein [Rhizoctonia solani 123E]
MLHYIAPWVWLFYDHFLLPSTFPISLTASSPTMKKVPDTSAETSNNRSSEPLERHPEFFFDNTLVAIQVEKTLFNVHKYQLVKSEVFSDMFGVPKPEGDQPEEGSSPENPIELKGVSAADFTALLRVLYASHFSSNPPVPEASLIVPAFRLANMFNFSQLRTFLLPLAEENLDDVDKIVFAREFDIKEWLVPAHVRLCHREAPLNAKEASKLGIDSVLMLWHIREQYRGPAQKSLSVGSYYCNGCSGYSGISPGQICAECKRHNAWVRYDGSGTMAQKNIITGDNLVIEAQVKRWIEDGPSVRD